MKIKKHIFISLSIGAALIAMPISCSTKEDCHDHAEPADHSEHDHDAQSESEHGGHSEHEHGGHGHEHSADPAMVIPETVQAVIHEIHEIQHGLEDTVKEKRLAAVHQQAFAIRDLANALPDKVSADKKTKVAQTVKQIAEIAVALDNSGDSGEQAQTEANLKKLDGLLKMLDAQVGVKKDEHSHDH